MRKVLLVLMLAAVVAAPVAALPALSIHAPTVTADSAPAPALPHLPGLAPGVVSLGMAIRVKDTATIAKKFVTRAGQAAPDYTTGVAGAGQDWQANSKAAKDSYVQGVQQSIADDRYSRGIDAAGSQKYTDNATKLGPQRYQTGVANSESAYARGVQPHLEAMRSLDLPPRGPKGSPQNQQRAQVVAARNRAIKLGK